MDKKMKDKKIKENKQVDYLDNIPTRVALLEMSIDNVNDTLKRIESRIDSHFHWTMGLISGLYLMLAGGLISVIVKLVH